MCTARLCGGRLSVKGALHTNLNNSATVKYLARDTCQSLTGDFIAFVSTWLRLFHLFEHIHTDISFTLEESHQAFVVFP